MTLILNGTDNSATTPAVTGTDTDTGVYYPTSNQVALATNGTNAVTVTSTQNVGIGTVGPNARVQIESTGNGLAVGANNFTPTASTMVQINSSGNSSSENILILASLNSGIRLTFPADGGIKFPATQAASADANTLDDYEEGTWTPSLGGDTTYYNQDARYTKIGNLVFIRGNLHINLRGTGSQSQISGLPFTPDASNQYIGAGYFSSMPTSVVSFCFSTSSSAVMTSRGLTAAGTGDATVNVFQNGTQILFSGVYRV